MLCAFNTKGQNLVANENFAGKFFNVVDTAKKIAINSINVTGNKKTKEQIIKREVQLHAGDSVLLSNLNNELEQLQQQVYNTNLFIEVKLEVKKANENAIDVTIKTKERWYIFPFPKFQLIDRNINEWLQKYNGDLDRVVYGVRFIHHNLTGRRDILRLTLLNGNTRNISATYFKPVSDKSLNNGFLITAGLVKNKDFIYKIDSGNKPLRFNNGDFSRTNFFAGIGFNYRKNIKGTHYFNITYNHITVVDSLLDTKYNPNYFQDKTTTKNYIDFSYAYQYVNANNAIYPLKGTIASFKILKRGLDLSGGTNMFSIEGTYNKYVALNSNWFASFQLSGKTILPFEQSYINQKALGYSDVNLRGLELFVVDGVAFGLLKNTLKKKLFTLNVKNPFVKSGSYHIIPFTVFAKTYADVSVVYAKQQFKTNLSNKLLYSSGFGIDILSIYDVNLRIEYSFNQLNKNGLFLQAQSGL